MRYHNIQILRVIAAAAVVGYHLDYYSYARLGVAREFTAPFSLWGCTSFAVPLFFVVSGFVLTHALQSCSPVRYLTARPLRLYPGYWLAIIAATILISDTNLFADAETIARRMTRTTLALFPPGSAKDRLYLLGIEWSLIYEVELSVMLAMLSVCGMRRGLPVAAGIWLAAILVKIVLWPGFATEQIPHWKTILLSAHNVPFLLGVFVYYLKERGTAQPWKVAAAMGTMAAAIAIPSIESYEVIVCLWGMGGACAVWLAVNLPQVSQRNPIARLGDCTYGLFLLHVPLMLFACRYCGRNGMNGSLQGVWMAGLAALIFGLLFGAIESRLHFRLRPLAKVNWSERVRGLIVRLMNRTKLRQGAA